MHTHTHTHIYNIYIHGLNMIPVNDYAAEWARIDARALSPVTLWIKLV